MYLHTNIPLPPFPQQAASPTPPVQEEKPPARQTIPQNAERMDEARAREERLRQADVPSMTDFFHVSRLPRKGHA